MERTFIGYLKLEKNKDFLADGATIGTNEIATLTISLVGEEIKKISDVIAIYNNPDKPIEYRYSMPIVFEKTPGGPECHVKCSIRKTTSLMKLIDWTSVLLKTPLQKWLGCELAITVGFSKYNFNVSQPNSDAIEGGANQKIRGVSFQIKSIKLASEISKR